MIEAETAADVHTCACGCGGCPRCRASRWLPGHHKQGPHPLADRYAIDAATGCWVWQGYRLPGGYGKLTYRGRGWLAHRLSYLLRHGGLPEGDLQVHHTCANRACINPDHLQAATPAANRRAAPTKLDADKARRIRELAGTLSQVELGERFGVDHTAIGQVQRGRIWRDEDNG